MCAWQSGTNPEIRRYNLTICKPKLQIYLFEHLGQRTHQKRAARSIWLIQKLWISLCDEVQDFEAKLTVFLQ